MADRCCATAPDLHRPHCHRPCNDVIRRLERLAITLADGGRLTSDQCDDLVQSRRNQEVESGG